MKYYKIKKCRCCKSTHFKEIIDFGNMSLSTSFTEKNSKNNSVPLKLIFCKKCYLTQLHHNYESNKIYNKNYGYRSGINKSMNLHLESIVKDAKKIVSLNNKDTVLDIASNDGTLLKKYKSKKIIKIGIDPTIKKFKKFYNSDILTLADYFTSKNFLKISKNIKAKIITSIAVFYDVPKPDKFIQDIKKILDKNGVWILEQSYLPFLIKNNAYDSVCHEHLTYFMVYQINILLTKFNLFFDCRKRMQPLQLEQLGLKTFYYVVSTL
ncbi:methyltransferase domain-containing protein [Pelagibacteraceae bacterium]|nr:methyltransferase domain-containing protein [Pelagibacteraceae bacterium]